MSDLRAVVRIKHMAGAAVSASDTPLPDEGIEMAAAYERLRQEARQLNKRAGWGEEEEFDEELPPLDAPALDVLNKAPKLALKGGDAYQAAAAGRRARVLLGQLAAWAAGHQEAFEIEERLKAEAQTRAAQQARKPAGFQ